MTFARVRAPGLWIDGTTVPGTQWEQFDANLANALDGAGGGAYSLTADMVIGADAGSPFTAWVFDLLVTMNRGVVFGSVVDFYDAVTFQAGATIQGAPLVAEAGATFSGGSHFLDSSEFLGPVDFLDNITVFGVASLQGGVNLNGAVNVYGPTSFAAAASADFAGTVTTNGSGAMRVRRVRRQTTGGDANATIDVTLTDHVTVPDGTLSATRFYTISDTGAVNGDRVRFSNFDTTYGIAVKDPGGTTLEAIISGTGSPTYVDVERISGSWRVFPGPDNP